jgi:hypothetical protein
MRFSAKSLEERGTSTKKNKKMKERKAQKKLLGEFQEWSTLNKKGQCQLRWTAS